jgi:hypothetical protein
LSSFFFEIKMKEREGLLWLHAVTAHQAATHVGQHSAARATGNHLHHLLTCGRKAYCGLFCCADACPPPDAFRIVCRQQEVPSCGPGGKPFNLNSYCTAFPVGAELQWVRASLIFPDTSNNTIYGGETANFTTPAVVQCPAAANGANLWWPFITSFKGRTNCFCVKGQTSCRFLKVGQVSSDSLLDPDTFNSAVNITIHGKSVVLWGRYRDSSAAQPCSPTDKYPLKRIRRQLHRAVFEADAGPTTTTPPLLLLLLLCA